MGRRTVLLVVALVVAALGTTMLFLYVNGLNDKAIAKQGSVSVLVAKKLINPGTSYQDASDRPRSRSGSSVRASRRRRRPRVDRPARRKGHDDHDLSRPADHPADVR